MGDARAHNKAIQTRERLIEHAASLIDELRTLAKLRDVIAQRLKDNAHTAEKVRSRIETLNAYLRSQGVADAD